MTVNTVMWINQEIPTLPELKLLSGAPLKWPVNVLPGMGWAWWYGKRAVL